MGGTTHADMGGGRGENRRRSARRAHRANAADRAADARDTRPVRLAPAILTGLTLCGCGSGRVRLGRLGSNLRLPAIATVIDLQAVVERLQAHPENIRRLA